MKVLLVEPPKETWFLMGEYLPPPYGIIQLGAYLENEVRDVDIEIVDCNAQQMNWMALEERIESSRPDIIASSSLSTCNTYAVARALQIAKKVNPKALTVTGGQHFTATAQESLEEYPEIDIIVRGEGEQTFADLVRNGGKRTALPNIRGISYKAGDKVIHNPPQPLIEGLDSLPYPGYHLVKDLVHRYHFAMMAGHDASYALIEGSRGCPHDCTFCTQWRHWQRRWRLKSARRTADEIQYCYEKYGSRFIWLCDDNLGTGGRIGELADELLKRRLPDEVTWFAQARCDDIIQNRKALPKLRKAGLNWVLLGVESSEPSTLQSLKKEITPNQAKEAVKLLKENDIFAHAMFIIGHRKDTANSIAKLREFVSDLDPDLALFAVLTPFPGTEVFDEGRRNGWVQDYNWSHYDMVHAIMPTETLTRNEVQEELYGCYRSYYGSWQRRLQGMFSGHKLRRRVYWHMAGTAVMDQLRALA